MRGNNDLCVGQHPRVSLKYNGPVVRTPDYWISWTSSHITEESWAVYWNKSDDGAAPTGPIDPGSQVVGYIAFEIGRNPQDANLMKLHEILFDEESLGETFGDYWKKSVFSVISETKKHLPEWTLRVNNVLDIEIPDNLSWETEKLASTWMLQNLNSHQTEDNIIIDQANEDNFVYWGSDNF